MRHSKATLVIIGALVAALSAPAFARGNGKHGGGSGHRGNHGYHGHHKYHGGPRVGVIVGAPLLAAPFYYPPYYPAYYPSSRFEYDSAPPVYIQQAPAQPRLYFCPALNAYFPQVRECAGGWQAVDPPG